MTLQENVFFKASDGFRLYRQTWGTPRKGVVIFLHGVGEHVGRYPFLMRYLAEHGYAIEAFDLRGHGQSDGVRGHVDFFIQYVEDFDLFLQSVKDKYPQKPLFLIGHSLGGHIIIRHCLEQADLGIRGVVLASPLLSFAQVPSLAKRAMSHLLHRWAPTFSLWNGFDLQLFSHDVAIVEKLRRDPLILTQMTARWYRENKSMMVRTLEEAARFHFPLFLQQSGEDHIAAQWANLHFFEQLRNRDKRYAEYAGYFHDIYNETPDRRGPVFDALGQWLDDHLPSQ